jgi:hypothetical protein
MALSKLAFYNEMRNLEQNRARKILQKQKNPERATFLADAFYQILSRTIHGFPKGLLWTRLIETGDLTTQPGSSIG